MKNTAGNFEPNPALVRVAAAPAPAAGTSRSAAATVFSFTLAASAFLLFSLEPLVAKRLLPLWGGSPSVWVTCTVFFQAMLLAGYLYAHLARVHLTTRRQALLHGTLLVLSLVSLPLGLLRDWPAPAGLPPAVALLVTLASVIGLPFFTMAANAPLLQHWFSVARPREDPYRLYAASNLGSLVALLGYPVAIEPFLGARAQGVAWGAGLVALACLVGLCARAGWSTLAAVAADGPESAEPTPPPRAGEIARWIALAFVPSSLMLGVTTYFTTDIAAIPLLWVLPLALYLLSFVLVFSGTGEARTAWSRELLPYAVIQLVFIVTSGRDLPVLVTLALHLGSFFVVVLALHSALARARPAARHLTSFYLWISFGGMLGGFFNSLVAPFVFSTAAEYPLVLAAACAALYFGMSTPGRAAPQGAGKDVALAAATAVVTWLFVYGLGDWLPWDQAERFTVLRYGVPALVCVFLTLHNRRAALAMAVLAFAALGVSRGERGTRIVAAERNFYGVLTVEDTPEKVRHLVNGTTIHGAQSLIPAQRHMPLAYYHRRSPVADVFRAFDHDLANRDVGLLGLGVGTMAAWSKADERFTYFEIDDKVIRAAEKYFTYLADSAAAYRIVLGDGRLKLAEIPDGTYALLIIDAFSSDAIPVHLLTKEAVELYLKKTAADGAVALHISNRHLKLEPVVGRIAAELGLEARIAEGFEGRGKDKFEATWVVLARSRENLRSLARGERWQPLDTPPGTPLWTDDFTSYVQVLNFLGEKLPR